MFAKTFALGFMAFLMLACQDESPVKPKVDSESLSVIGSLSASERATLTGDNGFGFSLLTEIAPGAPEANLFISPLSVSLALTMAYNGARGSTETAMAKTLGHEGMDAAAVNALYARLIPALGSVDPHVRFDIANSIWNLPGYHVEADFLDINRRTFGAETHELNFSQAGAAAVINQWVSDKTQAKITKLETDPMSPDIRMILINALYFKGDWSREFPLKDTREGDFTLLGGAVKRCAFMHSDFDAAHYDGDLAQVVELPYGDSLYAMDLILPKATDGMEAVETALKNGAWTDWSAHLAGGVKVVVPKLKLEYSASLVPALTALGMDVAFSGLADFSGITGSPDLYISDVVHKTYLEVDEKGTTAAAVTEVIMEIKASLPTAPVEFNRPFILLIREKTTGTVLFLGRMMDPTL